MTVRARVHELDGEGTELHATGTSSGTLCLVLSQGVHHLELRRGEEGGLRADVGMLGPPRRPAVEQERGHRAGGIGCGEVPRLGLGDPHRWSIGVARERHRSGGRRDREVGGRPAALGSRLAERGDRDGDQPGVGGAQGVEIDRDRTAFEKNVGAGGERIEIEIAAELDGSASAVLREV